MWTSLWSHYSAYHSHFYAFNLPPPFFKPSLKELGFCPPLILERVEGSGGGKKRGEGEREGEKYQTLL